MREAAHSSPATVKVKNDWSCNSSPLYAFMACLGTPLTLSLSVVYIYTIMFNVFVNLLVLYTYISMRR